MTDAEKIREYANFEVGACCTAKMCPRTRLAIGLLAALDADMLDEDHQRLVDAVFKAMGLREEE